MRFVTKEPILKGWSGDQKYYVTDENGGQFLLRISDATQAEKEFEKFEMVNRVASLGVPMCRPVEISASAEGVFAIYEWIEGGDAEDIIPTLTETAQYNYGVEAGHILKTIHTIPAPSDQEPWESRFNRKMDMKIKKYGECPIHYENGDAFLTYIRENRHLLKDRPQVYHHGDYHIGNFMIDRSRKLRVIDFNRCDYGDPWEEFNRIVWCAEKAPHFASGMVDGYFGGEVPTLFWRLLALYIASNTLSSVYWAIPFGEEEIQTMLKQAQNVLRWYDDMRNIVPTWYQARGREI